jgi:MFS family permease
MPPFVRDRFTWLAYLMLGYYAYFQAATGPLMPFLRTELGLSYGLGGLHFSAFALGMITTGLTADRVTGRLGRCQIFWGGAAGMAAGAVLLTLGRHAAVTICGAAIMGLFGSLLLITIQASLSDRHGERRAIAFTESNVVASVCATLAPLCVGGLQQAGIGWRGGLWLMVALAAGLAVAMHRESLPAPGVVTTGRRRAAGRLPAAYWAYWLVIVLCVAAEWCLAFWSADFLATAAGLPQGVAATAVGLFYLAMIIGRVIGSRLAWILPTGRLLLAALGVAALGFPLFWLARLPALNVAGLFVTGLGVANLYPLALSAATGAAAGQANTASARISLAAGLAILTAPLLLGGVADRVGIQSAYGLVIGLLAAAVAMVVWANRIAARLAAARASRGDSVRPAAGP